MPTVCAYRLYLPSVPTVCTYRLYLPVYTYCLCLPVYAYYLCLPSVSPVYATVYAYLSVIWGKGQPNQKLHLIQLIVLIRTVLYSHSLAVHLNGGHLGCLPKRP